MKPLIITLICSPLFICAALAVTSIKIAVKYSQIFAEKKIVLTEYMSFAEKTNLQNKKGFVSYE